MHGYGISRFGGAGAETYSTDDISILQASSLIFLRAMNDESGVLGGDLPSLLYQIFATLPTNSSIPLSQVAKSNGVAKILEHDCLRMHPVEAIFHWVFPVDAFLCASTKDFPM
jgi:hypothetical protein